MLTVISPAKTLDFKTKKIYSNATLPPFLEESEQLISVLAKKSTRKISELMSISDKLSAINASRYQSWELPFTEQNAKVALHAFKGDVYIGLDAETLSEKDVLYSQDHLRILSGLYGLLRPLDLIQPYRLEMGTKLKVKRKKNLYEFWNEKITEEINNLLEKQNESVLINLASNEYFSSVKRPLVNGRIITPIFKEKKNGAYKVISFNAKKARGFMSRYIIQNHIEEPEALKEFDVDDYQFNSELSSENEWLFTRY